MYSYMEKGFTRETGSFLSIIFIYKYEIVSKVLAIISYDFNSVWLYLRIDAIKIYHLQPFFPDDYLD